MQLLCSKNSLLSKKVENLAESQLYALIFYFGLSIFVVAQLIDRRTKYFNYLVAFFLLVLFSLGLENQNSAAYLDMFYGYSEYAETGYQKLISLVEYFGGSHRWILFLTGLLVVSAFTRKSLRNRYLAISSSQQITCHRNQIRTLSQSCPRYAPHQLPILGQFCISQPSTCI